MVRSVIFGLMFLPAVASAEGGGGAVIALDTIGKYGGYSEAPALLGCLGGMGYGVAGRGFRIGGEGMSCRGDGGVRKAYGGAQLGWWGGSGAFYLSSYTGIGGGSFRDPTGEGNYSAAFFYVRPTVAAGIALGPIAIETGLYAMVPFNLGQWVGAGSEARGFVTPNTGLSVSVLFGDLRRERRPKPVYKALPCPPCPDPQQTTQSCHCMAPPPPPPPPPAPLQPRPPKPPPIPEAPPADQPLAIPAPGR